MSSMYPLHRYRMLAVSFVLVIPGTTMFDALCHHSSLLERHSLGHILSLTHGAVLKEERRTFLVLPEREVIG